MTYPSLSFSPSLLVPTAMFRPPAHVLSAPIGFKECALCGEVVSGNMARHQAGRLCRDAAKTRAQIRRDEKRPRLADKSREPPPPSPMEPPEVNDDSDDEGT